MSRYVLIALISMSFFATGCQQSKKPEMVAETPVTVTDPPVVTRTEPTPAPRVVETPTYTQPATDTKIIYFAFDRSDVRAEDRDVVSAHASYLADNSGLKVRLEGHADERGSREYNIGLGERRAQAVRQALMLQGVSGAQIETLSYGEESPAVRGQGEFSWQQNRRVEIVYLP
ncbi:MAG: peptidoglycan-associated lipoprotein Pal [Gammaproteobacteria bacterium]